MNIFETFQKSYEFNRTRTLGLLDKIAERPDASEILGWRPQPGRAHICWQLAHIGVTEDIFASERLAPERQGALTAIWPRFRGGSTPDDQILSVTEIRGILETSRRDLREVLGRFREDQLEWVPEALRQRGLKLHDVLHVLSWHEAHHQGQAHLTLNLYLAGRLATSGGA